jgi:Heat induced stress protein YflT
MLVKESKRAVGLFPNRKQAQQALNELKDSGFAMDKVSIIAKDAEQGEQIGEAEISTQVGDQNVDTTGVVGDAINTGVWGSVLVGLSSLAIPGLGAVIAAGSVGAAFVTSIAGVAVSASSTNNLVQSLMGLGITEEPARFISDKLQQGFYLVILDGNDEQIEIAKEILSKQSIQGWGTFDLPQT